MITIDIEKLNNQVVILADSGKVTKEFNLDQFLRFQSALSGKRVLVHSVTVNEVIELIDSIQMLPIDLGKLI